MEGIADFLDSLIGGVDLTFFALLIGTIFWLVFVIRPWQEDTLANKSELVQVAASSVFIGAIALCLTQLAKIGLKIWLMAATLDMWPFPAFAETIQFQAGLWRVLFAGIVAYYAYYHLKPNASSQQDWNHTALLALPLVISGAWLVHGAGRFEDRAILMILTVTHQIAAAVWIGGVMQLLVVWRMQSNPLLRQASWPLLLKRFSMLGLAAVGVLLLSGIPIALKYIDTLNGFIGSGYGNLLLVKIILLGIALGFAWMNRSAVTQYMACNDGRALFNQVPYYVEAETFVLITLLFTAASLASQPPANDIPDLTATWSEVLNTFQPRFPRLTSPSHEALIAGEAGRVAIVGQVPSEAATAWSDYNHNVSGIFLAVMSFFAMLSYFKPYHHWARYWPVGFVLLGIFLFFRSDAETWPLGPIGFWESTFNNGEVLQHRIATLLVFMLGVMEIRARITTDPDSRLPYVFPLLAAFGGLMLLTHSHVGFQAKTAFLIQVGHTLMGVFSLVLACGRWLELKLDSPGKNIAGFLSVFALFQIGLILMFYREPLY
ncbi:MAG: copper resistance D family protein [Gammaproteobacteria bacterium]